MVFFRVWLKAPWRTISKRPESDREKGDGLSLLQGVRLEPVFSLCQKLAFWSDVQSGQNLHRLALNGGRCIAPFYEALGRR